MREKSGLAAIMAAFCVIVIAVVCGVLIVSGIVHSTTPTCRDLCNTRQILRLPVTYESDLNTLDPAQATDSDSQQFVSLVFPGLVALDQHEQPIPWAAAALPTVSADGLTWTFHVRPGLKWSDGAPINAATYAYSLDRAENPCNSLAAAYYLYPIKDAQAFNSEKCSANLTPNGHIQTLIGDSITTPDPLTLQITLAQPATYFLVAMASSPSYAVPEQIVSKYGSDFRSQWTDHLTDNGGFGGNLFKVTQWNHRGDLILKANLNFWGKKPTLREIDVTFYPDASTAYRDFQAGKLDVGYAPLAQLKQAQTHKTFHQIAIPVIDYYALNWTIAPFDDIRMRQAFAIALNKQALAQTYGQGSVIATNHIIPDGTPGYNPYLVGPDGTNNLTGNIALANQLATQYAAATHCGTATDFSKCPPVFLAIYDVGTVAQQEADAAVVMWRKAMPNYPVRAGYPGDGFQAVGTPPPPMVDSGWIQDYPDPQDWLSTNLTCDSHDNLGSACDPQADALLRAADANPNQYVRLQQYQQAEQSLVNEVAWLPLDQGTTWWETGPHIQNFTKDNSGLTPFEAWQSMYVTG